MRQNRARPTAGSQLGDMLTLLLPTELETRLLRACLWGGEAGRCAWQEWRSGIGGRQEDLSRELHGRGQLLPLLYQALRNNGADVDKGFWPYLRTSFFREELRSQACRRICAEALAALTDAGRHAGNNLRPRALPNLDRRLPGPRCGKGLGL